MTQVDSTSISAYLQFRDHPIRGSRLQTTKQGQPLKYTTQPTFQRGISAREEEVLVPMVDAVRDRCRHLLRSGGTARWLEMARGVACSLKRRGVQQKHGKSMAKAWQKHGNRIIGKLGAPHEPG